MQNFNASTTSCGGFRLSRFNPKGKSCVWGLGHVSDGSSLKGGKKKNNHSLLTCFLSSLLMVIKMMTVRDGGRGRHLHVSPYKRPETFTVETNCATRQKRKKTKTTLTPANDRSESPIENNDYRLTYLDELRGDRFGMCILGAFHLLQL